MEDPKVYELLSLMLGQVLPAKVGWLVPERLNGDASCVSRPRP